MKQYFKIFKCLLFIVFITVGCKSDTAKLQSQVDSLTKQQSAQAYKPGLGEFMLGIQIHHAKLWFAGKNQNWDLANFEIGEIQESVDDINKYCTDRPEVRSLPMLYPALDSLNEAIKAKNIKQFQSDFAGLTNTCNSCHHITHHGFNVIKIPDNPPFSNQDFRSK